MVHRSRLVIFYLKEKFCVLARVGKTLARCLLSKASKKIISPVIFDTNHSFNCSFFNQIINFDKQLLFIKVSTVCRSHFVIFNFLQGKVICFGQAFSSRLLGPC